MLLRWRKAHGGVEVIAPTYDDQVAYYADFYTTDHHWNGYGAIRAYNEIAEQCGLERVTDLDPLEGLTGIEINGSNARQALDLLNEPAREPKLDTKGLTVGEGTHSYILESNGVEMLWEELTKTELNFYEAWYGSWVDTAVENSMAPSDKNALLICDSFGTGIRYPIAKNYRSTLIRYDMHMLQASMTSTLESRVKESGCSAVYFVARPQEYLDFIHRYPKYFE